MPEISDLNELLSIASPGLLSLIASSNSLVKNRAKQELKNRGFNNQGKKVEIINDKTETK